MCSMIPDNSDAAFSTQSNLLKLSDLLLHYNYGAAAIKMWGCATAPRPPLPQSVKMGPSRTTHNRTTTIGKLEGAWDPKRGGGRNATAGLSMPTHRAHDEINCHAINYVFSLSPQ